LAAAYEVVEVLMMTPLSC